MRRRSLPLRWLWLLLLTLLGGGAPARADQVLTVYAQAYTPEVTSGDNPSRLHEFTRLAEGFERLHPGVRVQFLKNPVGDYRTWMRTQLKGGMAPDIMWAHADWCNEDARYGWFVALDPYLARPNPYVAAGTRGAKQWLDEFYPDATNARRAPDGRLYSLPIDQVETCIFYNRDLFDRIGARPPKTWDEFIELHRRFQAAGIVPFVMTAKEEMRLTWTRRILLDQLYADVLPQMDVRKTADFGYPGVDAQEFVRAYKKGLFSVRDERYREHLRLLKEWSRYWGRGYLALGNQDDRLFRLGKCAMWWDGSWFVAQIERDPLRTFRYGMFLVPPLTRATSRFATSGIARGVGGAASIQYVVTNSAVRAGKEELAVDFLRYITAPAQLQPLVSEAGLFLPNVIGLEGSPRLRPFMPVLKTGATRFGVEQAGARYTDRSLRVLQGFLGGTYSEEETLSRLERYLDEGVQDQLRDNAASWRFSPDWEILPPPSAPPTARTESRPQWVVVVMAGVLLLLAALAFGHPGLRRYRISYLFLLPTFVLIILFSYYPIFSALGHSFTEWRGSGESSWVGLANFREMARDDVLGEATGNALKLLAAGLVITLTAPLLAAELIFSLRHPRHQYLYRVLFLVPMVVPGVVILLIWGFLYDDNLGLINRTLGTLGLARLQQSWLGDTHIALYSLMFMGFPWVGGFALLIYYAGLQNIPGDVFDAARIDGAVGWSRFRMIDLPLLLGQIKLLVVLGFIGGLQSFQTQLLLTNGGPAYSTTVPGIHLYQNAIQFDRMGYACAIGVALFLVILGITYLNLRYLRSSTEYQPG